MMCKDTKEWNNPSRQIVSQTASKKSTINSSICDSSRCCSNVSSFSSLTICFWKKVGKTKLQTGFMTSWMSSSEFKSNVLADRSIDIIISSVFSHFSLSLSLLVESSPPAELLHSDLSSFEDDESEVTQLGLDVVVICGVIDLPTGGYVDYCESIRMGRIGWKI